MESLNRLIDHLGENRVNLAIVQNEFEQAATTSCPSVLEKLYETCDSGSIHGTYEKMVECFKSDQISTLTKKQRNQIQECWRENQLCDLNDGFLDYLASMYACNVIVVVFESSNSFVKMAKGIHNSKPETKTCFLCATSDLLCDSVKVAGYEQVKADLVANVWVDQNFVTKCLSAIEVKILAKALGLDTSKKGLLKKELVTMICDSLHIKHQKN